jgi:hypothetical protein
MPYNLREVYNVSADTNTGGYVVFWTVLRVIQNVWGMGPVLVVCVVDRKNCLVFIHFVAEKIQGQRSVCLCVCAGHVLLSMSQPRVFMHAD